MSQSDKLQPQAADAAFELDDDALEDVAGGVNPALVAQRLQARQRTETEVYWIDGKPHYVR